LAQSTSLEECVLQVSLRSACGRLRSDVGVMSFTEISAWFGFQNVQSSTALSLSERTPASLLYSQQAAARLCLDTAGTHPAAVVQVRKRSKETLESLRGLIALLRLAKGSLVVGAVHAREPVVVDPRSSDGCWSCASSPVGLH
jgi:hypothetical protein